MSKHSLIATGLGLGLMAASMGASAQLQTFDYSSMYYGAAAGGSKYVSFVPTIVRGAGASDGAAGVVMLELYQPLTGSASTWAFALGGAVGSAAGGAGGTATRVYKEISLTAENGLAISADHYLGNVVEISHAFTQLQTVSSQACQVTFAAVIGTNGQLAFKSVEAQPVDFNSATADVIITTGTGPAVTISESDWNNASKAFPLSYAGNSSFAATGLVTAIGSASVAGESAAKVLAVNSLLTARGRCVPAYTARAAGSGTTITGDSIGMVRIY